MRIKDFVARFTPTLKAPIVKSYRLLCRVYPFFLILHVPLKHPVPAKLKDSVLFLEARPCNFTICLVKPSALLIPNNQAVSSAKMVKKEVTAPYNLVFAYTLQLPEILCVRWGAVIERMVKRWLQAELFAGA